MNEHERVTSDDGNNGVDRLTLWLFWLAVVICAGFGGWALFFRAA